MDDADSLLLSLEVEAAAARNADLSRRLEEMQSRLLDVDNSRNIDCAVVNSGRNVSTYRVSRVSASTTVAVQTDSFPVDKQDTRVSRLTKTEAVEDKDADVTFALLNLDDALFDILETMALLHPQASGGAIPTVSSERRSIVGGHMTLSETTAMFLSHAADLKQACRTRMETFESVKRNLENELEALHTRYRDLETGLLEEIATLKSRLDDETATNAGQQTSVGASGEKLSTCQRENENLRVENEALRRTLDRLQSDMALRL